MIDPTDVHLQLRAGVARITINRPEQHNALTRHTVEELSRALRGCAADPAVEVIVLTGQGDLAFSAGLEAADDLGDGPLPQLLEVLTLLRELPKPVVALVRGYALGAGHALHLACDLSIAADNAIFGQTVEGRGSAAGGETVRLLALAVGQKRAREIGFLCRQYSATEALAMGLVNTVAPLSEVEDEALRWCRELKAHAPAAIRGVKEALSGELPAAAAPALSQRVHSP